MKILVIGSLNIDFAIRVENMPVKGETVLAKSFANIPGGKGANQSYACGALGANTSMLGCVGNDDYGKILLASMQSANVNIAPMLVLDGVPTGMAMITIDAKGENSIVVVQGANSALSPTIIDENYDVIAQADIILMQLEIPMETVVHAAKIAFSLGKMIILDPAPAPVKFPEELYKYIDIIKPNEHELEGLLGYTVTKSNLPLAAAELQRKTGGSVIVTLGSNGAYLLEKGKKGVLLPSCQVPVIDTTAAGDAFTAAIAVSLAKGETLDSAVQFANIVSSVVVTRQGAQTSIPHWDDIELQSLL